ncbi:hypothetical protein [Dethiothermospora halolimnae]|uniref:hypothetical protein n=1 Tax=Dethiothermospora halolimnae TaxID=3114390 RepID=UPI003CCBE8FC
MSLSLKWLMNYGKSKGGYDITPNNRHLEDLKILLKDMQKVRKVGQYNGELSLGDLYDEFEKLPSCSCDSKHSYICSCESRCACDNNIGDCNCESRCTTHKVPGCDCDNRCACDSNVGNCSCEGRCACDNNVGNCNCESRCTTHKKTGCSCDNRCACNRNIGSCDCENRCNCVSECSCNSRCSCVLDQPICDPHAVCDRYLPPVCEHHLKPICEVDERRYYADKH